MTNSSNDGVTKDEQGMRISAVSRITGIPTDTLRAWERRYELVSPGRSGSAGRVYSRDDVHKLGLIKQLVDRGHAISNVAACSVEELNDLLALHGINSGKAESVDRPLRLLACGEVLSVTMKHDAVADPRIEVSGLYSSASSAAAAIDRGDADVLVLEYASLHKDTVNEIVDYYRRSRASSCVVIYAYSSSAILARLEKQGFLLRRAPLKTAALVESVLSSYEVNIDSPGAPGELLDLQNEPPRVSFSNEDLALLSSTESPIKCECPQHLADLILNLNRFELYSADCENRNEEDAALHNELYRVSGHARGILEKALHKVVEAEGLTLA